MYLNITYTDVASRRIANADQNGRITSHLVLLGMELPDEYGSALKVTYVSPHPTPYQGHETSLLVKVVSIETRREYSVWFQSDCHWMTDVRTGDCRFAWRIDSYRQDGTKAFRGYNRQRSNSELALALLSGEAFPTGKTSIAWTVLDVMRLPGHESHLLLWFGLNPVEGCSATSIECDIDDPKQVVNCIPWLLPAERKAILEWKSIDFKAYPPIVTTREAK